MIDMLINALILLAGVGLPLGALFWKHFSRKLSESTRAVIATLIGTVGMAIFFLQVAVMTAKGENLITIITAWFNNN